jgi:predicted kinase
MSGGEAKWWQMPGPSAFLKGAAGSVMGSPGGLLAIQTPREVPDGFIRGLRSCFQDASDSLHVRTIDVTGSGLPPQIVLADTALGFTTGSGTIQELLEDEEVSDTVFIIHGFSQGYWRQWVLFLKAFEVARAKYGSLAAPRVICIVSADIPFDNVNVFKNGAQRLIGLSTRLDTELYVAGLMGRQPSTLLEQIAFATVVEIAAWDFRLADIICSEERDIEDQINPIPLLEDLASRLKSTAPTWANGLVDTWDGRQYAHSVAAAADGDLLRLRRRVWLAQARVMFPLFDEVLARTIAKYEDHFQNHVLPIEKPGSGTTRGKILTTLGEIELTDLWYNLQGVAPSALVTFLKSFKGVRTRMAHQEACTFEMLKPLDEFWTYLNAYLPDTLHGWDWPDCNQKLLMMIGPSCAGKSTYAKKHFSSIAIISSDDIRIESTGSLRNTTSQEEIFRQVRLRAIDLLKAGSSVVIDATHLRQDERLQSARIAPPHIPVEYIVCNRPMAEKERDQGDFRRSRPYLLVNHERHFNSELANILQGDGLPNVTVRDTRDM